MMKGTLSPKTGESAQRKPVASDTARRVEAYFDAIEGVRPIILSDLGCVRGTSKDNFNYFITIAAGLRNPTAEKSLIAQGASNAA
jgi:hypothetical protein